MVSSTALQLLRFIVLFILSWQAIFRIPNVAINTAFKFFYILLHELSDYTRSDNLRELAEVFPNTLLKAQAFQSIRRDDYKKLIVCPECYCTYDYDDCLSRGNRSITTCSFVRFPKHPQARMRKPCCSPLLKTVKTSSRKIILHPIKVFCYRSLIEQLKYQPQILDLFSHWKGRVIPARITADIYDVEVWKSFLNVDGEEFLSSRYNLGMLTGSDHINM